MKRFNRISLALIAGIAAIAASCSKPDYSISISTNIQEESIVITSATPVIMEYTVNSSTGVSSVEYSSSSNITVTHIPASDKKSGKLILTLKYSNEDSYVQLDAANEQQSASYRIKLEMETIRREGDETVTVGVNGGNFTINVSTNVEFEVSIPEDAREWLSVNSSKTIATKGISLTATANDDVNRSAKITVYSKTAKEVNTTYIIEQAGILNNIRYTNEKDTATAPDLLGDNPSGKIYWGDGFTLDWSSGAMHRYSGSTMKHTIEIHTKSTGFKFNNLLGVSKIDITDIK